MKRVLLVLLVLVTFESNAAETQKSDPEEIVQDTLTEVLEILNNDTVALKDDPAEVERLVDEILLPVIDFNAFSKLTLGHSWRQATADQRQRFINEFKGMLIRTYTKYLVDYSGTIVKLVPNKTQQRDPKRRMIITEVSQPGKSPLVVSYSFWFNKGKWKAYNLTVDGLSLVHLFRTDFNHEIDQTSLDTLIGKLADTNRNVASKNNRKPGSAP
ncbi:MAG: ABC transporter substrate-binding protein [Gammaproteobacteria bacterium]|nr:ABC transporter substrate-binding protein [Gammaproteobacteria bacterium]